MPDKVIKEELIAKVRLFGAVKATDREYDYLCPESKPVSRGSIVSVSFGKGNRHRVGVVTHLVRETPRMALKKIESVYDPDISLSEEQLILCEYLQNQIFCTFGEAASAMLPSPVYQKKEKTIRTLSLADGVDPSVVDQKRLKNKEKYHALLAYLALSGPVPEPQCRELFDLDAAAISFLLKKNWITGTSVGVVRDPVSSLALNETPEDLTLNDDQKAAFEKLASLQAKDKPSAALLYGVTGSGKTRVMLALCERVLNAGKTVMFLVPEIALTGQSARLLVQHFQDQVAILHSALTAGQRRDTYAAIRRREKTVVLGTRSAVFAPLSDLGLIVIDEEQDSSYKSDTKLKYHARDIARFRCAHNKAMLLLASATPDIESYYKANAGKYFLVTLKTRTGGAVLPTVRIVDVRPDLRDAPGTLIGRVLRSEIQENLSHGEQSILLMNRRGYRRFVICADCGEVITCPNCSVSMTLHNTTTQKLPCHYCGFATPLPSQCPHCSSTHLMAHGYGIQKLEEELSDLFPQARVLRLDSDTLAQRGTHEEILRDFRDQKADILIGTQMVAKGHNFPEVTLVGVVSADSVLYGSDYRASEHAYSLLTQVVGRAGRSVKPGRAVIQTMNPAHNVFDLAARQDYEDFYEGEIALRKEFIFPPFCSLAQLTLSHESESELLQATRRVTEVFKNAFQGEFSDVKMIIYGPFEASVYRVKRTYRKRFIIKYKNNPRSRALFRHILDVITDPKASKVSVSLDIGPGMIG